VGGDIGGNLGTCTVTVSEGMYLRPVPGFEHVSSDTYYPSGTSVVLLGLTPHSRSGSTLWRVRIGAREGYVALKTDASTIHTAGNPCDYSSIGDDATPLSAAPRPVTPRTSTAARTGQPRTNQASMLSGKTALVGLALVAAGLGGYQYRKPIGRWFRKLGRG
jgi:hypothetical protein